MAKIRYEVDPHNRLILKKTGKQARITKYRTLIDGRFNTSKNNYLIYHAKIPGHTKELQQIRLRGRWSLNKKHDLEFALNKWGNQIAGNKLTLKGNFISSKSNKIGFAVTTKDSKGKRTLYTLNLSGRWKIDKHNRLNFNVQKERETDTLIFQGDWKLKNNIIVYSYKKYSAESGKPDMQSLTLSGYWDIKDKYRISYEIDKALGSALDFRTSVGVPMRQNGRFGLKYELGAGSSIDKEKAKKAIIIFGKWKIKKGLGVIFEVEYGKGVTYPIKFTAIVKLNQDYSLNLSLRNRENKDLGIRLQLSRQFMDIGKGFIRFLASRKEKAVEIGMGFRW